MPAKSVSDYLATLDPDKRAALDTVRAQIAALIPDAEEIISYGIPAYRRGRVVCGVGATKKHCALYLFSDGVVGPLAEELKGFSTSKGTVRFTPSKPLPSALVEVLVRARLAECDALDAERKG